MKRKDLIKYLSKNSCYLLREGSKHTVYYNSINNKTSTIPRHTEIDKYLVQKICKDLDIEIIK
jgi:predicted RNA binding protein YcfA (HicA-like mRNA interferase family)